ncbi:MAG: phosphate/phosphite/phosphonate ABC transporter substrate-binding protein [Arcobacteraceae bacterium]|nr:phosphate/phosphite/phosphonate ABC transporter substrate-binding protein [Arcobacteraceae bacterium]
MIVGLKFILIFLIFVSLPSFATTLKMGIFPYTDPIQIIKIHNDLRDFISKNLGVEVEIYTANSFLQYYENTKNNHYDIIITPPHFGAIHIIQGFVPVYRYDRFLSPVYVVREDSDIKEIKDFKNKKIALSNHVSISSISGLVEMSSEKIDIKSTNIVNTKTHQAAVTSVIFGESDVAITTHTPINQMSNNIDMSKIKLIEGEIKVPHVFTLASPNLDKETVVKLKTILKDFEATKEGKEFFTKTGFLGYTDITKKDLDSLIMFIIETKKFIE